MDNVLIRYGSCPSRPVRMDRCAYQSDNADASSFGVRQSSYLMRRVTQKKQRVSVGLKVALGFTLAIAFGLFFIYFLSRFPSAEEGCRKECATKNRSGRLIYTYPPHMVSSEVKNPQKCECYWESKGSN